MTGSLKSLLAATALAALLAGCQPDELGYGPKHLQPLSPAIKAEMSGKDMTPADPILVRLFKEESELEVWKQTKSGKYALLKTYDICKWSGELGPKVKEGDRQAPEGFYTIRPAQMNPNSSYHLSFNLGFPNSYDRALGRTGSHLMVHGACSSRGCYAMEDEQIQEIYSLARESFRGGQRDFQVQAFPFRLTAENMARHADNENIPFWRMLKRGSDHFEVTRLVPKVDVCGRQYVFDAQLEDDGDQFVADRACPAYRVPQPIEIAVASKQRADEEKMTVLAAEFAAKREREERWKNGDTALAKIFTGGASAAESSEAETPAAEEPATPALAYAGAPVPAPNPNRLFEAKPASGGFFSGLFKRESAPAPAPEQPQQAAAPAADQTPQASPDQAAAAAPLAKPGNGEPVITQSISSAETDAKKKSNLAAVSDLVSRWFGGAKPAN